MTSDQLEISAMTDRQMRGADCVLCGQPVRGDHVRDLGQRRDADGTRVFPRAHPECWSNEGRRP
ncbi:hypothetical protein [Streptomyces fuscigenes]|uniref:hypothetical protein n=1 Tax=Streptomyces fuscigenes TaxID=1528880 RepID=UPI001F43A34B|nr:hypothetical protein [Streptomyces fuscigenes]MCF3961671.1 hypothetical protein [Streptomyces fuscigenes]